MSYFQTANSTGDPEWPTPQWLVDTLAAEFTPHGFTLDVAATPDNAKAPVYYTASTDGLVMPWPGYVWCAPPYGHQINRWTRKAHGEVTGESNRLVTRLVVMLVPARVGTNWWIEASGNASLVRILPGRLVYEKSGNPAPFPSAILVYGPLSGRHARRHLRCVICDGVMWKRAGAKTCSDACRKALSRITKTKVKEN